MSCAKDTEENRKTVLQETAEDREDVKRNNTEVASEAVAVAGESGHHKDEDANSSATGTITATEGENDGSPRSHSGQNADRKRAHPSSGTISLRVPVNFQSAKQDVRGLNYSSFWANDKRPLLTGNDGHDEYTNILAAAKADARPLLRNRKQNLKCPDTRIPEKYVSDEDRTEQDPVSTTTIAACKPCNGDDNDDAKSAVANRKRGDFPPKAAKSSRAHKFACAKCLKRHLSKIGLEAHYTMKHSNEDENVCAVCKESFTTLARLQKHFRNHVRQKPHRCTFCGKYFAQKSDLTMHRRIHTGEKPFSCKLCPKSFTQKIHLTVHMRVHTGERPFGCHYCMKRFATNANLKSHGKVHVGLRPYHCHICKMSFSVRDHLVVHIMDRSLKGDSSHDITHECRQCGKHFISSSFLERHMREHTPGNQSRELNFSAPAATTRTYGRLDPRYFLPIGNTFTRALEYANYIDRSKEPGACGSALNRNSAFASPMALTYAPPVANAAGHSISQTTLSQISNRSMNVEAMEVARSHQRVMKRGRDMFARHHVAKGLHDAHVVPMTRVPQVVPPPTAALYHRYDTGRQHNLTDASSITTSSTSKYPPSVRPILPYGINSNSAVQIQRHAPISSTEWNSYRNYLSAAQGISPHANVGAAMSTQNLYKPATQLHFMRRNAPSTITSATSFLQMPSRSIPIHVHGALHYGLPRGNVMSATADIQQANVIQFGNPSMTRGTSFEMRGSNPSDGIVCSDLSASNSGGRKSAFRLAQRERDEGSGVATNMRGLVDGCRPAKKSKTVCSAREHPSSYSISSHSGAPSPRRIPPVKGLLSTSESCGILRATPTTPSHSDHGTRKCDAKRGSQRAAQTTPPHSVASHDV